MGGGIMARMSRDKGARGEREVARLFAEHGFAVRRVPNSGGLMLKGDLMGDCPLHVEVKFQERLNIHAACRQAQQDAPPGSAWAVFHRRSRERWYATLPAIDLLGLLEGKE